MTACLCDLSTTSYEANAILAGGSVASAGILGVSAFRLKHRPWNVVLGAVASLALCVCLFLGTIGFLAVMFVVGDTVPVYVADLPDHLRCHVTSFGNATTSEEGYDVEVGRRLVLLPFIEVPAAHRRFDSPSLTPKAACDSAVSTMRADR